MADAPTWTRVHTFMDGVPIRIMRTDACMHRLADGLIGGLMRRDACIHRCTWGGRMRARKMQKVRPTPGGS